MEKVEKRKRKGQGQYTPFFRGFVSAFPAAVFAFVSIQFGIGTQGGWIIILSLKSTTIPQGLLMNANGKEPTP